MNQPLSAKSLVRQNPPGGTLPRCPQHTFHVNLFALFTVNIEIALKVKAEISDEFRSASPNHARSGPHNGRNARDDNECKSKSFGSPSVSI